MSYYNSDFYHKRSWDKAKYRPDKINNEITIVGNDTINICNALLELASGIGRLKGQIDSSGVRRDAGEISYQVEQMSKTFGRIAGNAVKDIKNTSYLITTSNRTLARNMDRTVDKMDAIERMLERYRG